VLAVANDPITDAQRESLGYYLQSENRVITPLRVLRFYYPRLGRWAIVCAMASIGITVLAPSDAMISVRSAMLVLVCCMFAGLVALSVRTAFASVEHWRLLQRVLDWDSVRSLYLTDESKSQDGG